MEVCGVQFGTYWICDYIKISKWNIPALKRHYRIGAQEKVRATRVVVLLEAMSECRGLGSSPWAPSNCMLEGEGGCGVLFISTPLQQPVTWATAVCFTKTTLQVAVTVVYPKYISCTVVQARWVWHVKPFRSWLFTYLQIFHQLSGNTNSSSICHY